MTSVEIEDVLSSIRRLVTDDLRPKPVADNKLMLTPALRVVPDAAAAAENAAGDVLDVDLDADLNAALADDANTPEADVASETYPMFLHRDRRVDLPAAQESADVADAVMTISAGIPADDFEAELGDVMAVPEWPEASWVAPDVIDVVEEAELIAAPEMPLETPIETPDNWLADQPAVVTLTDDDEAEAAALAALAEAEVAQEAGAITELDEDMLRDIVRDIIREELQGTLGEKITRNVRKLVRAEINRALMTQDLD